MAGGDSYRQQIMTAVKARMAAIRTASGYRTDIGRHGFEFKAGPWQDLDIPGHELRDTPDKKVEAGGKRTQHALRVEITAVVKGDAPGVSSQMRDAIADISQAIGTDPKWGLGSPDEQNRLVLYTEPLRDESAEVVHENKRYGSVTLAVVVHYITDRWGE